MGWVTMFKQAGLISIHKCVAIRHALSAEKLGCDIISLDGFECAGHPGEDDVGNFVLQAKGAKVLKKPYVCSGGVGDGIQLAAALALGADGVNCGTRFCATKEGNWPGTFKEKIIKSVETDTVLMFRQLHNTARVMRNTVSKQVEKLEKEKGMNLTFNDVASLVGGQRGRDAEKNGDPEAGIWTAGQVVGLIDDIPTCKELMQRIVTEAETTVTNRLQSLVIPAKL